MVDLKICNKCKVAKPTHCFTTDRRNKGGRGHTCRSCVNASVKLRGNTDASIRSMYRLDKDSELLKLRRTGHCEICNIHAASAPRGVLFIDHDHATGKVRGLLCSKCNIMLGMANDNTTILSLAIDYLKRTQNWSEAK